MIAMVRAGTLDAKEKLDVDGHIFTSTKVPWVVIPEGQRQSEGRGGGMEDLGEEAKSRVMAASGEMKKWAEGEKDWSRVAWTALYQ